MEQTNIIALNKDDYLPRWKWSDLALILAESLPAYQQPLMEHLLYTLKADAGREVGGGHRHGHHGADGAESGDAADRILPACAACGGLYLSI